MGFRFVPSGFRPVSLLSGRALGSQGQACFWKLPPKLDQLRPVLAQEIPTNSPPPKHLLSSDCR